MARENKSEEDHEASPGGHRDGLSPKRIRPRQNSSTPSRTSAARPHRLIAVAEDDDDMRALLASALEEAGYDVLQCSGGAKLLIALADSLLDRNKPKIELVISDVRMPGVNGLQLLERTRAFRQNIPVIIITAFGDDSMHEFAFRFGATAVFDKPFVIDDLVRTVHATIASDEAPG